MPLYHITYEHALPDNVQGNTIVEIQTSPNLDLNCREERAISDLSARRLDPHHPCTSGDGTGRIDLEIESITVDTLNMKSPRRVVFTYALVHK